MSVAAYDFAADRQFLVVRTYSTDEELLKENQIDAVIQRIAEHLKPAEISPDEFKQLPAKFRERILKLKENELNQKMCGDFALYLTDKVTSGLLKAGVFKNTNPYLQFSDDKRTLKLESVHLDNQTVKDMLRGIDPADKEMIAVLDLSGCNLKDLSGLEGFNNVVELNLARNSQLKTLAHIGLFPNVHTLNVTGCGNLETLKGIEDLANIAMVDGSGSGLIDIGALTERVSTVKEVKLSACMMLGESYQDALSTLVNCETLELCNLQTLHYLHFVAALPNLKLLNVNYSAVIDIEGIAHLPNLHFTHKGCDNIPGDQLAVYAHQKIITV